MQQELTMQFEEEDWRDARTFGFESAIGFLLSQQTGTSWRFAPSGVGVEILPPHRSCVVYGYEALNKLVDANEKGWKATVRVAIFGSVGRIEPFASSVTVIAPSGEAVEVPLNGLVTLASRFLHASPIKDADKPPAVGDQTRFA